jgi:hypothetical protein
VSDFGTFILDRGLFDHPFFAPQPFTEREAWAWMIGRAARAEGERRVGNLRINLRRGELAHSGRFLAKRWDWSHSRVQRFLARLVTESMIESVTESGLTRITICNYDKYQLPDAASDPPGGSAVGQTKKESSLPTDSESDGGGDARAREPSPAPMISEMAHQLAREVMQTLEIDIAFVPPGWCGAALWFETGIKSNWRPELVRIAAAKVRARRHYEPPWSYTYLLKPIEREHKLHANPPLPIPPVAVRDQEQSHAAATATDWRSRNDAKHAAYQRFAAATERRGNEGDETVVRLVPNARRG